MLQNQGFRGPESVPKILKSVANILYLFSHIDCGDCVPVHDLRVFALAGVDEDPPLGPILDLHLVGSHLAVGVHVKLDLGEAVRTKKNKDQKGKMDAFSFSDLTGLGRCPCAGRRCRA